MDTEGFFPGDKAGGGVKPTTHLHLAPTSRMRRAIPPLPQYVFIAWSLVKHRDNFTFTFSRERMGGRGEASFHIVIGRRRRFTLIFEAQLGK